MAKRVYNRDEIRIEGFFYLDGKLRCEFRAYRYGVWQRYIRIVLLHGEKAYIKLLNELYEVSIYGKATKTPSI